MMLSASTWAPATRMKTDLWTHSHPPGCYQSCTVWRDCLHEGGEVVVLPSTLQRSPGTGSGHKLDGPEGRLEANQYLPEVSV